MADPESTLLRGPLVENAVKFLQDPAVRASSVSRQIAFLEGKGLTRVEIEEAMRQAKPETPSTMSASPLNDGTGGGASMPANALPLPTSPPPTELLQRRKKSLDWGSLAFILALIGSTGVMLTQSSLFSKLVAYLRTLRGRLLLANPEIEGLREEIKRLELTHTRLLNDLRELKAQLLENVDAIKVSQNYLYRELGQELEEIRDELNVKMTLITTNHCDKADACPANT